MREFKSEVSKIKHEVLRHVAELAFAGELAEKIDKLPRSLSEAGITQYRCCVYKERAVLAERAKFSLGFSPIEVDRDERLGQTVRDRLSGHDIQGPVLDIIDIACDQCPIDRYIVTDACRGCVAHYCVNSCVKEAISIVGRRAYIDQDRCVECGRCTKVCHFHAIVEVHRPCERSCPAEAIKPGEKRNSVIHHDLCTACGACIISCPFGAIADKSQLIKVIEGLIAGEELIAILAPAIAGQFGPKVEIGQVMAALLATGFSSTAEVAQGADEVARLEAEEFDENIKEKQWLASSCCPGFVNYIKKHFPQLQDHIATTPSPMVLMGRRLKEAHPNAKIVFIGPCIAKKEEALQADSGIDAVLTFEELAAIFDAKGVDPADYDAVPATFGAGSPRGRAFAVSGGVAAALASALEKQKAQNQLLPVKANGLEECKKLLRMAAAGKLPGNFLEGMACEGGCVGGPAVMVSAAAGERAIEKLLRRSN